MGKTLNRPRVIESEDMNARRVKAEKKIEDRKRMAREDQDELEDLAPHLRTNPKFYRLFKD